MNSVKKTGTKCTVGSCNVFCRQNGADLFAVGVYGGSLSKKLLKLFKGLTA